MRVLLVVEIDVDSSKLAKSRASELDAAPTVRDVVRRDVKEAITSLPYAREFEVVYIPELLGR